MELDCVFSVNMMSDQKNVGILASVGHCIFELTCKENWEVDEKRKLRKKMKVRTKIYKTIHQKQHERQEQSITNLPLRILN